MTFAPLQILPLQTMLLLTSAITCSIVSVSLELRKRQHVKPTVSQVLNLQLGDSALKRLVISFLLCCIIDAYMTLEVLHYGGNEVNPVMAYFVQGNEAIFVLVKYIMTASCVFLLAVHSRRQLFSVLSTITVLKFFAVVYALVINYEVAGYLYFVTLGLKLPDALDQYLHVLFV